MAYLARKDSGIINGSALTIAAISPSRWQGVTLISFLFAAAHLAFPRHAKTGHRSWTAQRHLREALIYNRPNSCRLPCLKNGGGLLGGVSRKTHVFAFGTHSRDRSG